MIAKRYFLFVTGSRVEGYVSEYDELSKTSVYEDFRPDEMERLWDWFVGAMSYKLEKETADLCVVGDCADFDFSSQKVSFDRAQTHWTIQQVETALIQIKPHRKIGLIPKQQPAARHIVTNNERQGFAYMEANPLNVFWCGSREVAADAVPDDAQGKNPGILYEYFNKQTTMINEK